MTLAPLLTPSEAAGVLTTMRYAHVLDDDLREGLEGYSVTGSVPKEVPKSAASD